MKNQHHSLLSAEQTPVRVHLARSVAVMVVAMAGLISLPAMAEPAMGREAPMNMVSLSASGFLEVQQDWLTVRMNVTREGGDAASVQTQLKTAVDSALATARGAAAANQQMQVRSGNFGVYPRYDKSGKISNWTGNAELILDGRDFTRIARTAGQITSMTIAGMDFSLSREAQQKLETDVQALAIERFRARATDVAKGFGMSSYRLGEISISSADQMEGRVFARSAMAMEASKVLSSKAEPMAVEPGNSKVNVTVSGTVQLK
jgi:predicted secreted protein